MELFDKGSYRDAIAAFRSALLRSPNDRYALFYLALGLYRAGQFKRSLEYWKRLRKLNPTEGNLHLNMGCAYQNLGRDDLAIRYFKVELGLNPVSGESLYSLGVLYYNRQEYKKAVNLLERCYALKHSRDQIVAKLAWSYFKTKELSKEIDLYLDWLQGQPKDKWALNNLGAALMQAGEFNRAQMFLQRANVADPADEMVQRNLKKVRLIRSENSK